MTGRKGISIGYEDLKEIIEKNLYYVDKTDMLSRFMDSHAKVNLFIRPRRFGKTLNLSMFRRFFEDERNIFGVKIDNSHVFEQLQISSYQEICIQHQQQYPVINLSLKSAKQPNFQLAYDMMKRDIAEQFERHKYVLNSEKLSEQERDTYASILKLEEKPALYVGALKTLSSCLKKYHEKKCVILIDEYDVPLETAWFGGFYDQMTGFIRSLFESALKTNDCLEFAVITGCLRISRESIFTGLNNLKIDSILNDRFSTCFGFTEPEVKEMLAYYGLSERFHEVKEWYDGYIFGTSEVYNPWSIINYTDDISKKDALYPKPYWSNTSSNSIIRELVEKADNIQREEIERLLAGETLEKPVHEDITYEDVYESSDNLWNFLFFTGYLKSCSQRYDGENTFIQIAIPNIEIQTIYRRSILTWFDQKIKLTDLTPLILAIEEGDCENIGNIISEQLMDTISFFDYGEDYYHGFLAGLLKAAGKYRISSNRENGIGRTDITMKTPFIRNGLAVIFELKVVKNFREMEEGCQEALKQVETRQYEAGLRSEGYSRILKYGICFFRKECIVQKG